MELVHKIFIEIDYGIYIKFDDSSIYFDDQKNKLKIIEFLRILISKSNGITELEVLDKK